MSRRIRPSARKKTWHNVMCSELSETDKKCIEEVFEKFELQKSRIENLEEQRDVYMQEAAEYSKEIDVLKADKEALIAGQETLQKFLAEKDKEIERMKVELDKEVKKREVQADRLREERSQKYMQADMLCKTRTDLSKAKSQAIKEFADKLKGLLALNGRVSNEDYYYMTIYIDNLVKEMVGEG